VRAESATITYSRGAPAVDSIDLVIPASGITCLLGANGAGKTSLLEAATGLRPLTSGTLEVLGSAPGSPSNRTHIGVMLQDGGLPGSARPVDFLNYVSRLYSNPRDVAATMDLVDIADVARTPIRRLSGGQASRVAWAAAMLGNPRAMILDEPTSALDPVARSRMHEVLAAERERGAAMIVATHLIEDVARLADHLVVLHRGSVVVTGTPDELRPLNQLQLRAPAHLPLQGLVDALPAGSSCIEEQPGRYRVCVPQAIEPAVVATVTSWCAQHGVTPEVTIADLASVLYRAIEGIRP